MEGLKWIFTVHRSPGIRMSACGARVVRGEPDVGVARDRQHLLDLHRAVATVADADDLCCRVGRRAVDVEMCGLVVLVVQGRSANE